MRNRRLAAWAALLLLAPAAKGGANDSMWQALAPLRVSRHDLQLVAWNGKLIAISGAHDQTIADVDLYDRPGNKWTPLAPIPEMRGWFGAASIAGRIYCAGGKRIRTEKEKSASGDGSHYEYRAGLNIYDPETDRWTVGPPMSAPRAGCCAAALDGKLYVIGGSNPTNGFQNRVEIYDPVKNAWQDGPSIPDGREDMAAAAIGGKIYALGGVKFSVRADVYILDPATGKWSSGAPMPTPRRSFAAAVDGPRLWCVGGVPGRGYTNVVEIYDTREDKWSAGPPLPEAKAWMGAAVLGGGLYVAGGAWQDPASKKYIWLGDLHRLPLGGKGRLRRKGEEDRR